MSNLAITQMQKAAAGITTPEMVQVATAEFREPEEIRKHVAAGTLVIPRNIHHSNLKPVGIGRLLRTKINANIGNSTLSSCPELELEKLNNALKYGADTVMDLSTGSNIPFIRKQIIKHSPAPIGTVPVYEALSRAGKVEALSEELILQVIREQAEQGVDYMTVHSGVLFEHLPLARKRLLKIVSRGGSILARWMKLKNKKTPSIPVLIRF